jgi:AraC-like DNA-binding protein
MPPDPILEAVAQARAPRGSIGEPDPPLDGPSRNLGENVRRALRNELLKGPCSAPEIASLFGLHPRKLVDEVRFEIARDLLANTRMALSQIASVLRFSEPSAFTRAFERWSGQTPSVWRASHVRGRRRAARGTLRHAQGSRRKRERIP